MLGDLVEFCGCTCAFCRSMPKVAAEAAKSTTTDIKKRGYQILSEGGRSQANTVLGESVHEIKSAAMAFFILSRYGSFCRLNPSSDPGRLSAS